jgi:ketosteroid isomerase-like protein
MEVYMESMQLEKELLGLEKQFWQALKDGDVDTVMRLTDDSCIVAGPQGFALISREALGDMMKNANYTLDEFELKDDAKVRFLSDNAAVLAYKVHTEMTVEGKPVSVDAADTSSWIKRNGHWVCALHTESILGDPFGRDRKQAN